MTISMMAAMNWRTVVTRLVLVLALIAIPVLLPRGVRSDPNGSGQLRIRDIMSTWTGTEAWAADIAKSAAGADAKLKAALQKRLLVPNVADLSVGPPSPAPLPGVTQRTITVNGGEGRKFQVELFSSPSSDNGILAQAFAPFNEADPWDRVNMKLLHLSDRPTLGPVDAPVTIVEFADFECPYCARAFNEIETLVNTTYKGKVRLMWKAFPLQGHAWAEQAAIAAECVRQQNPQAFWTIAGDFYRDQSEITPQNLRQHIDGYTSSLNLDGKALNACILGNDAEARVDQDKKDGGAVRIMSTPTFLVNGVQVVGLPTSNVFDFVITSQMESRHASR